MLLDEGDNVVWKKDSYHKQLWYICSPKKKWKEKNMQTFVLACVLDLLLLSQIDKYALLQLKTFLCIFLDYGI